MQGDIRNESTLGLVRYSWKASEVCLIVDWMFGTTNQKKLLKLLVMSVGLVSNLALLLTIVFGDSD